MTVAELRRRQIEGVYRCVLPTPKPDPDDPKVMDKWRAVWSERFEVAERLRADLGVTDDQWIRLSRWADEGQGVVGTPWWVSRVLGAFERWYA